MGNLEYSEYLAFAKKLAIGAGEIIKKERVDKSFVNDYKNDIELVYFCRYCRG